MRERGKSSSKVEEQKDGLAISIIAGSESSSFNVSDILQDLPAPNKPPFVMNEPTER